MLSWAEFQRLRPDVAEAGHRLLYQFGVGLGFLATIRVDGGPRLHPMCPLVTEDALLGFLHPSPKRQDLYRDGRYALHCFPPDDNEDAFYISGRAVLVDDRTRRPVPGRTQAQGRSPGLQRPGPVRVLPRALPVDTDQRPWGLEPASHDLAGDLTPTPHRCWQLPPPGLINPTPKSL